MRPPGNDLKLLTEVGYSATLRALEANVGAIFDALALWRPDNAASAIGRALQAMVRRDFASAIEFLERDGTTARESAEEARSILVLARKLAGRGEEAEAGAGGREASGRVGSPASARVRLTPDRHAVTSGVPPAPLCHHHAEPSAAARGGTP